MIKTNTNKSQIAIKVLILIALISLWQATQFLIQHVNSGVNFESGGIYDRLLLLTMGANDWLRNHEEITKIIFIISSMLIDIFSLTIILHGLFSSTVRWLLGLILLMLLRQACQLVAALKIPSTILWFYPGFPSIFVSYSVSVDLFFSGHTALAVYSALVIPKIISQRTVVVVLLALIAFLQILMAAITHIHYFMDIYAGAVTAVCVYLIFNQRNNG